VEDTEVEVGGLRLTKFVDEEERLVLEQLEEVALGEGTRIGRITGEARVRCPFHSGMESL